MNALTPFDFEGRAVRVVEDVAGLPWFVALDVCEALGLGNNRQAVARLDEDERSAVIIDDTRSKGEGTQARTVLAVNEAGLYSLTLTSRKPEAKRFKRWITHEVLPALRRTGRYSMVGTEPEPPALPAAPSHRADTVVSATRSLTALVKAGLALGLPRRAAALRANERTLALTGIDLAEMLDVDLGPDAADAPARATLPASVDSFLAEWRDGRWPVMPALSTDVHAVYLAWCQQNGHQPVAIGPFAVHLRRAGAHGARKRWWLGGVLRGPHGVQWPGQITQPPESLSEPEWLGQCIDTFRAHHLAVR
jgi:prophage antirepressor-like protein